MMKATTQPWGTLERGLGAETRLLMISSGHTRTIPASAAGRLGPDKHPDILLNLLPWCGPSGDQGLRKQHQGTEGTGPPICILGEGDGSRTHRTL